MNRLDLLTAELNQPLSRLEVKRIDFPPGFVGGAHTHPCPVAGYIVSGTILMQVEGQNAITLREGDAFLEPAHKVIQHFDNASSTATATFVAFYLVGKEDRDLITFLKERRPESEVTIVDYSSELREYFESLNREWLEEYFKVESVDLQYFKNPEGEILSKGGEIFFALFKGRIIGTCTLDRGGDGPTELARMAVTQSARGMGIGQRLLGEAVRRAKARGEKELVLVTNTKLVAAIALYEKNGFTPLKVQPKFRYERANLAMELKL